MLNDEQVIEYQRDGFVVARGVFTAADVQVLRDEVSAMWERSGCGTETQNVTFGGIKKMSTIRDPQLHSGVFTRFLTDPRLTEAMAALVGPDVQLHHSKINVKTVSDGVVFPLHQDYPYFPHADNSVCTVLVHLSTTTSRSGCFRAIPGVKAPLEHVQDEGHVIDPREYPLEVAQELPAEAGDVVFMNYLTPHGSNLNEEDAPRILWIIQVRAANDRPVEQKAGARQPTPPGERPAQGTMLHGINPEFRHAASGASSRL